MRTFNRKVTPELLHMLGFGGIEERDFFYDIWVGKQGMFTIGLFFGDADVFYSPDVFDMECKADKSIRSVVLKDTKHITEIFETLTNRKFRFTKREL